VPERLNTGHKEYKRLVQLGQCIRPRSGRLAAGDISQNFGSILNIKSVLVSEVRPKSGHLAAGDYKPELWKYFVK
jgi:hypothetical protein